jgi:hypothetical protein
VNHAPALAAIEQSLLAHVEALDQALIDAAQEAGDDASGDECLRMGTYHNHVLSCYVGLLPTAQLLSEAGLTKLAARLSALIAETRESSMTWFVAVAKSWNDHLPKPAAPAPAAPAAPSVPAAPSAGEIALQQQQARFQEMERLRAAKQAQFDAWKKLHDEQQAFFDKQNADWAARFKGK